MESLAAVVFWLSVAGIVYAYVGYPAVVWVLANISGRSRQRPRRDSERTPFVSLLIAAHNEETVITERIKNAVALDYPADRIEIVIASDGSTDRTEAIVRGILDPRVRLIAFDTRRGKTRVLNEVIPALKGEIVILSDANTSIEPAAVHRLVDWFSDSAVGVVVGRLVLIDPADGTNVDSLYWRYETFLKRSEARLNALLGANGAIYGLRRSAFAPIPNDTLLDDFVLPLLVKLRTRSEIIYDTAIIAFEETPAEIGSEFRRRSRIGAGGAQSITMLWRLLSPTRGWIAFTFASHKVLRWCGPFLLLGALGSNALLREQRLYQVTLLLQGFFYLASAAGAVVPGSGTPVRLLRLTTLFTAMNLALLTGFGRWATRGGSGIWQPTARGGRASRDAAAAVLPDQPSPIKVVHVVIALQIGGLEVLVASLARHATRHVQPHVLCLESLGPVAARLENANVSVECLGEAGRSAVRSVISLRRRLQELRPDVLHTHNEKAHIHTALATLGWPNRPALVHTRHGRIQASGWTARMANRLAVRRSAYMVSVSDDGSTIMRSEGAAPERMRVIRNGIDIGAHDPATRPERADCTRAVAISRLAPVKDVATMLHAARLVADVCARFHLDVVGDGPSREELEALQRTLCLEEHVTFHGAADDVKPFLAAASVFVQSSISEGIPLTVLEAMASGLPVVATRVGGMPEVVQHGVTGFLVRPRDPRALADALLSVLTDRSHAASMGAAARKEVELHFSLGGMIGGYEALYKGVWRGRTPIRHRLLATPPSCR